MPLHIPIKATSCQDSDSSASDSDSQPGNVLYMFARFASFKCDPVMGLQASCWQKTAFDSLLWGGARRLQAAARTVSEAVSSAGVFATPKAAAYWGYHLSRSSFFLLQGLAGAPYPIPVLSACIYSSCTCDARVFRLRCMLCRRTL